MLNIGNVTLLQDMIWIHSCETLLPDRDYWVRNTLECSGNPSEEGETGVAGFERDVLQRNRKKMAQKEGGESQRHRRGAVSDLSRSFLWDMTFSNRHGKAGEAKRGACIPKNTEAKYLPDIQHILGSGSLHQTRESLRAIGRSASPIVIPLRNFHARSEYTEAGLQCRDQSFLTSVSHCDIVQYSPKNAFNQGLKPL